MSKKLFSLIYGDQIHLAPGNKIVPAHDFSVLLEAQEILERVKQDTEKYRLQVAKESEQIKENAYKAGYEEGYKAWAEQLVNLESEIKSVHENLQQMVMPVALKAAKKIVGRELELSENTIVDIVASNLKAVAQHKRVTIYVNRKDWEIVEKNKLRLKELFENVESLSVRARDDVEPGGCIIETEVGIINAQLEHRWRVLEKAFEKMIQTSPESLQDG